MNYNDTNFEDFSHLRPFGFTLVRDADELSRRTARIAGDLIKEAGKGNREVLIILPVGPIDYRRWSDHFNAEGISCQPLWTMNMDEYLDDGESHISPQHPLSFKTFIKSNFIDGLRAELRPDPKNVMFPDPAEPEATTAVIESFGGADICFGGMGITGHLAFNDPPEPGENVTDEEVKNSRTRTVTINRESATQMAMGGVGGNWDILPKKAVTLGMYELLLSKKLHLTFMRRWHAGVLRRALFGPVSGRCPGSFVQDHPNVEVTLTRIAADPPLYNVAQSSGEDS